MSESEILVEAERLVHLIRDLDADVEEVVKAVKEAPPEVRKAAHALMLMQNLKEES
jgi:hypothetical protein